MFGLGFGEIVIILIIAVIVVGPEHLPEMARKVGQTLNDLRRMYENLRSELGPDFDEIEKQVRNLRAMDPRRELTNVGRRVLDGLTDEVPELANLNETALRQQIIQLQAQLRDTTSQTGTKLHNTGAKIYNAPNGAVVAVDPVVERRQTLERLGQQLLNDDVLDAPLSDTVAHTTNSV